MLFYKCSFSDLQDMVLHTVYILVLLLVLFMIHSTVPFSVESGHFNMKVRGSQRCSYSKGYGMMSADCYGLDLTEIPQNLRSDIEVCLSLKAEVLFGYWR
jgi:hypothetical protein